MRLIAATVAGLVLSASMNTGTAAGPLPRLQPRDLFSLEWAADPQVRPDGGAVAYVRCSQDVMTDATRRTIWLVDPESGTQSPVVAGEGSHGSPRWSPDGSRLAYVSTAEGDRPQLFIRWMATGASARIASLPNAPAHLTWSPDGRFLAFTSFEPDAGTTLGTPLEKPEGAKWAEPLKVIDAITYRRDEEGYLRPGYTHTWIVPADGGAPRQLTFGAFSDAGPLAWTADGRKILFTSDRSPDWKRHAQEADIFTVDVTSGAIAQLTARKGPDVAPAISPDGRLVAYVGFDDRLRGYENLRLLVMEVDGSRPRVLTGALDRSVEAPRWAPDGKSVYVLYTDRAATKVARVGLDGRLETVMEGLAGADLDRPYSGGDYSVGGNGLIAATVGDPSRPPDLAVAGKTGVRRLTRMNEGLLPARRLAPVEPLPVTSSFDQRPIDAWMVTPPDLDRSRKHPMILEIHGGPFASYGPTWSSVIQLYAAAGYVVVYSNPRGSTSYGDEFANLIDRSYPSQDYDDLMSVVDAAIAKGFVDPRQLFVTGGSGGGVLTAWIVGKTDRFRGAAVQKPVSNWASFVLTSDGPSFFYRYWFSKAPWEDPDAYWKRSPLSLVGNVKTPTLVIVGDQDYRTPVSESEQYYTALQIRGVPTALVKVPGASHESYALRPSQSAATTLAILSWFDKYRQEE
jgi:dipeptidyl aminopeptidase/acylaminoacyl peptidase